MRFTEPTEDPQADLWADPAFVDAYCAALGEERERYAYDDEVEDPPFPEPVQWDAVPAVTGLVHDSRALAARIDQTIWDSLRDAELDPVPWVGPDPTDDPDWVDPRKRTHAQVRRQRRALAIRSAAADLAVSLHLSEHHIRGRAHRAATLHERCPRIWDAYLNGDVSEHNAATAATLAASLPGGAPESWAAFDDALAGLAVTLAGGKFRTRARTTWERVHPESVTLRHQRALKDRDVVFSAEHDGMASINALVDAVKAKQIEERLYDHARHLRVLADEDRSLAQLRADVFTDLLTTDTSTGVGGTDAAIPGESSGTGLGSDASVTAAGAADLAVTAAGQGTATPTCTCRTGSRIVTTVNLTIPALSLLGHSDELPTLEGYGPIPLEQARELAAGATQWVRVLTHPIDSTVLDVERRTYRFPDALCRWLHIQHPVCVFPGCQKPAKRCDTDHRKRWADGGHTSADNGAPLCEHHHTLKDETLWHLDRNPDTGTLTWTSPTGLTIEEDPPPF